MKINFDAERKSDTFLGFCLIAAVTKKFDGKKFDLPIKPGEPMDVQFTVNGVELPLNEVFDRIESQIDRMVAKKAFDLLKDKLSDMVDVVDEIMVELSSKARERLGLNLEDL